MPRFILSLLIASIGLMTAFQFPVDEFLKKISEQLAAYQRALPQEKIYLHLDKPLYQPGDMLWIKAYVLSANDLTSKPMSDVLYVNLINPRGTIEQSLTLRLNEGLGNSNFLIPKNSAGGIYKVQAYTQWQKNFGENSFFEKEIIIQKTVSPRLLLKLDFPVKAFGPGDLVKADFEALDLTQNPIKNQNFDFLVNIEGKKILNAQAQTNAEGKTQIQFQLPTYLVSNDGLLNVIIQYDGKSESISRSIPIVLNKIDLQFMPEGGNWIANLEGKVAFKALNEFGKPADVAGIILNDRGESVANFASFHQGMGYFIFKPQARTKYYAQLSKPYSQQKFELPVVQNQGLGLQVSQTEAKELKIKAQASDNQPFYVIVQAQDKILYQKKLFPQNADNQIVISTADFPIGIAKVSIFDAKEQIRAERLVFVNPNKVLNISILPDKKEYKPREKVELTLKTTNEKGQAIPANLSLAVVNDKILNLADDKQANILASLLLDSELKGKVEEPNFYFDPQEAKATQALDLVMLTHGWRRYNWAEVMKPNYQVQYHPERLNIISGKIIDPSSKEPERGKVMLFELGGKKRALQIKTDDKGRFSFLNTNPDIAVQLIAESENKSNRPLQIIFDDGKRGINSQKNYNNSSLKIFENIQKQPTQVIDGEETGSNNEPSRTKELNQSVMNSFSMQEDVSSLSEVVVTGYSIEEKSNLTGAIAYIRNNSLENNLSTNIEHALQGRAAGVIISPGAQANPNFNRVSIRGISGALRSNPLFILNGMPLADDLNNSFGLDFLNPEDIYSIQVIKSGEAATIFGSRAANGAVIITTKNAVESYNNRYYSSDMYAADNFNVGVNSKLSAILSPRAFSQVKEFYSPKYTASQQNNVKNREDYRTTLFWQANVQTDQNGIAKVEFYNSDEISTFRVIAEGVNKQGLIGRGETTYYTLLPLNFEVKLPAYLTQEDTLKIPIYLKNNKQQVLNGKLKITCPPSFKLLQNAEQNLSLAPQSAQNQYIMLLAQKADTAQTLKVEFIGEDYQDNFTQKIDIQPKGFPTELYFGGYNLNNSFSFNLPEILPNTLQANILITPDLISNLISGVENIFQRPSGCFEQVSAKTYPNVMALQYLKSINKIDKTIEANALNMIADGYRQLAAYETKQGGFEWYGGTPPHEALTAFGLLELTEMKKVYDKVDVDLLKRTKDWLLARRDGRGGFKQNRGKYGFSAASNEVNDAYIVYALAEVGERDIMPEFQSVYKEAFNSQDAYRMALVLNAAYSLKQNEAIDQIKTALKNQMKAIGINNLKADHSVTYSGGVSLQIETLSLIALAEMKDNKPDLILLENILQFVVTNQRFGYYGSTQGTILALQFLSKYAELGGSISEGGKISVYRDKELIQSFNYEKGYKGKININLPSSAFKTGLNKMNIRFENTQKALAFSCKINWQSYTPDSQPQCKLAIQTRLDKNTVKVNETVRLSTRLTNQSQKGVPMSMALVGIPSGLSPQIWQLKELTEKGIVDFYEIHQNYIALYYRELGPKELKIIHLDLKAEIPGVFQAPANNAYLYYTEEHKNWTEGVRVRILE
jgi:TonB-dependent SusC/RagA subfamily outer membrane receptor